MTTYTVFLGYSLEDGGEEAINIEAKSEKEANKIAYYMWLAWGLNNDIDGSNYYIKKS